MAEGISSDPDLWGPLALHVLQENLADIEGTAASEVVGLRVQVLDDLAVQLKGDAALAFRSGPAGHGGAGVCSHIIRDAKPEPYRLRC